MFEANCSSAPERQMTSVWMWAHIHASLLFKLPLFDLFPLLTYAIQAALAKFVHYVRDDNLNIALRANNLNFGGAYVQGRTNVGTSLFFIRRLGMFLGQLVHHTHSGMCIADIYAVISFFIVCKQLGCFRYSGLGTRRVLFYLSYQNMTPMRRSSSSCLNVSRDEWAQILDYLFNVSQSKKCTYWVTYVPSQKLHGIRFRQVCCAFEIIKGRVH